MVGVILPSFPIYFSLYFLPQTLFIFLHKYLMFYYFRIMKTFLITLFVIVSGLNLKAQGQELAYTHTKPATGYNYNNSWVVSKKDAYDKKQCGALRLGEVLMISGGFLAGVGTAMFVDRAKGDFSREILPAIMICGGGFVALEGNIIIKVGVLYTKAIHPKTVSVMADRNHIGLVCNF